MLIFLKLSKRSIMLKFPPPLSCLSLFPSRCLFVAKYFELRSFQSNPWNGGVEDHIPPPGKPDNDAIVNRWTRRAPKKSKADLIFRERGEGKGMGTTDLSHSLFLQWAFGAALYFLCFLELIGPLRCFPPLPHFKIGSAVPNFATDFGYFDC